MRNQLLGTIITAGFFATFGMMHASGQQDSPIKQEAIPRAETPVAAAEAAQPRFIFTGFDDAARVPETFSINRGTGIGTFTTRTATGELQYVTNTLTFSGFIPSTVVGSRFAVYEAPGLNIEFAFLVDGSPSNPVFVKMKNSTTWSREGLFNRFAPRGNFF